MGVEHITEKEWLTMLVHRLQVSRKVMRDYENLMMTYEDYNDKKELDYIMENGKLRMEIIHDKEQQNHLRLSLRTRGNYFTYDDKEE